MITSIRVTDRREAEKERNGFGAAIISVTDTDMPIAKLNGSWSIILRLKFDDIDPKWYSDIGAVADPSKCFSADHAKEILDFMEGLNTMPSVSRLVVHCEHGVSRSGAIGEFLAKRFGIPLTSKKDLVPNLHVFKMLNEEFFRRSSKDMEQVEAKTGKNGHLIIIRGPQGSGKTTAAERLSKKFQVPHFEADQYFFLTEGKYNWTPEKSGKAHKWCLESVSEALAKGENVIVANTFLEDKSLIPYFKLGHDIDILDMHGKYPNVHNVPQEAVEAAWKKYQPLSQEFLESRQKKYGIRIAVRSFKQIEDFLSSLSKDHFSETRGDRR